MALPVPDCDIDRRILFSSPYVQNQSPFSKARSVGKNPVSLAEGEKDFQNKNKKFLLHAVLKLSRLYFTSHTMLKYSPVCFISRTFPCSIPMMLRVLGLHPERGKPCYQRHQAQPEQRLRLVEV